MAPDLKNTLIVGISSRALFSLELENSIFESKGLPAFSKYQREHESTLLSPGTAFPLVRAVLSLNHGSQKPRAEVMILSKNHPDVYLRVRHSIKHHGLDITRSFLTGGDPIGPLLGEYGFDLFLSADEKDVRDALALGFAAARIYTPPADLPQRIDQIRIAFDGDCVLFSDEAEIINTDKGLRAFQDYETRNADVPLPDGPFATFLRKLAQMQDPDEKKSPFRIGLVTARNAPADERPLRTLRSWGVRIDSAAFLGGLPKAGWLKAFQPHIFFDDQEVVCEPAARVVPTAQVPVPITPPRTRYRNQFLLICKTYLGATKQTPVLEQWYAGHFERTTEIKPDAFLEELEESIQCTPPGEERPVRGGQNLSSAKLLRFLDELFEKHNSRSPRD